MEQISIKKTRGESEVSKAIRSEIQSLSSVEQKNQLIQLVEEHPGRIASLLYFAKLWSSEGADPEKMEWENLSKNLRSAQLMIKRGGESEMMLAIVKDLEQKLTNLNSKFGVYPALQN